MTAESFRAWVLAEQAEREAFEQHVRGELRDIKSALDLMLKAMEIDERQHDALENGRPHV